MQKYLNVFVRTLDRKVGVDLFDFCDIFQNIDYILRLQVCYQDQFYFVEFGRSQLCVFSYLIMSSLP